MHLAGNTDRFYFENKKKLKNSGWPLFKDEADFSEKSTPPSNNQDKKSAFQ